MLTEIFSSKTNIVYREQKEMAYVIDGQIMSVGELLGGATQDSRGGQLRLEQVKGSYPPVFEAKGTDNNIYSFEMTSMFVRLCIKPLSSS
jgi:hypothetical protein